MIEVKAISLVLVIILYNSLTSYCASYKCEMHGKRCDIQGLNCNEIEPVADNPSDVTTIWLCQGTVPILSGSGICEALPNLQKLWATELSMEEIQDNAFQGCKDVKQVVLRNNNLIKLEVNAFKGLTNLNDLRLYSNHLFDLDIESLLQYTPELKKIYLADNNFKCSRLREILDLLKTKNITADPYVYDSRKRDYTPEKIDEIHCLFDCQYKSEYSKLSIEKQALVKPLTTTTTKKPITLDDVQKQQDERLSYFDEKLNYAIETFNNQTIDQDEKFSNLKKDLKTVAEILNHKIDDDKTQFDTLNQELEAVETNQNQTQLKKSVEATIAERIANLEEKLNKKFEEQEKRIQELHETFNQRLETMIEQQKFTSSLLLTMSSTFNMLEKRVKYLERNQF